MVANNRLLWLPGVLRNAGVKVTEVPGWQNRGHTDDSMYLAHGFAPQAVIFHHDGSPPGDSPGGLQWIINGFKSSDDNNYDAQCWVGRDGVWHIVAAGYAQHAGAGHGFGAIPAGMGNPRSFGVETDHTTGETWPAAQLKAVLTGMAAICKFKKWDPMQCVVGHKEYTERKDDPAGVDMPTFRGEVATLIKKGWDKDMEADEVRTILGLKPGENMQTPQGDTDRSNKDAIAKIVALEQQLYNMQNANKVAVQALSAKLDQLTAAIAKLTPAKPAG